MHPLMQRIALSTVLLFAASSAVMLPSAHAAAQKPEPKQPDKQEPDKDDPDKDDPDKADPKESPQAAVVKQMLGVMDQLSTALSGIKDAASADAARPKLRKLAKEWTTLRDKAAKVPPPAKDEKAKLEKEFKAQMELAQRKLFGEVARVRGITGGREALEEIRGVLTRPMK